jgi:molecular chaperone DnaK (HSP70)
MSGSGWSLGIDFGTSFTTGAMVTGDGPPALVEIDNSRYLPSVVVIDRDGHMLTGLKAKRQATVFPERAERVPKRALVAGPSVVLGDGDVPVTALVAAVLGRIYAEAVRFQGGAPPESVVLTHPARGGRAAGVAQRALSHRRLLPDAARRRSAGRLARGTAPDAGRP